MLISTIKNSQLLIGCILCVSFLVTPNTILGSSNKLQDLMRQEKWKIVLAVHGELFFLTPDGKCVPIFDGSNSETSMMNYPTYSPNGKQIAYSGHGDQGDMLIVYDFSSRTKRIILKSPLGILHLSWSPDGRKILFLTNYDRTKETFDLSIVSCETCVVTNLTKGSVNAINSCTPSWSSNSKEIVFSGINGKIVRVNIDNKQVESLFDGVCPTYSPDGKNIIYRKGKNQWIKKGSEIEYVMKGFKYYLYNTETKQEEFLFNGGKNFGLFGVEVWQSVIWSPDGKYIMFFKTYDVPTEEHICIMDIARRKVGLLSKVKPFSAGAISWVDCSAEQHSATSHGNRISP